MNDFDASAIEQLRPFGASLVHDMIALFTSTVPPRIEAARAAAAAGDHLQVRAALHSAKGAAGQVGALALQQACAAGETAAREGAPAAELQRLADAAAAELERALAWLGTMGSQAG